MACFHVIMLLFIIFATHLVDHVLPLEIEGIAGGHGVRREKASYHVGILGQVNRSDFYTLKGSGALIAENLVLSAAQCFVNNNGTLADYHFSIIAATNNCMFKPGVIVKIRVIYLPSGGNYYLNDIAVTKLERYLRVYNNPNLSVLQIPLSNESFRGRVGKVTGYGYNWITSDVLVLPDGSTAKVRVRGGSDYYLRVADVYIRSIVNCSVGFNHIDIERQFCGLMFVDRGFQYRGICDKDAGSPVVVDGKIVGLASWHHLDCDDTINGIAYTKLSTYARFVHSIMQKNPLPGVIMHYNRKHLLNIVSSAA